MKSPFRYAQIFQYVCARERKYTLPLLRSPFSDSQHMKSKFPFLPKQRVSTRKTLENDAPHIYTENRERNHIFCSPNFLLHKSHVRFSQKLKSRIFSSRRTFVRMGKFEFRDRENAIFGLYWAIDTWHKRVMTSVSQILFRFKKNVYFLSKNCGIEKVKPSLY